MQTSGLILDMHDDNRGELIREIYPTLEAVPEMVKQAQRLSQEDLSTLPDDCFALVLRQGDAVLRKYACVDPGNTELSIQYLLKTAHKLPKEAAKLAAKNLMIACGWYDIDIPEELQKVAMIGQAVNLGMKGLGLLNKVQTGLGAVKAGGEAMKGLGNASSIIGHGVTGSGSDKMAEVTFTETMPAASSSTRNPEPKKAVITKTGSGKQQFGAQEKGPHAVGHLVGRHQADPHYPEVNAPHGKPSPINSEQDWDFQLTTGAPPGRQFHGHVMSPNIEVRGKEGPDKPVYEKKASKHALGDRDPLDTLIQIKQAAAYFDEFGVRMPPVDRHNYCVNMVKAAEAVGVPVSEEARKYGAERYAPAEEMKVAMDVRKRALLDEQHHRMLDGLFEKRATMSPDLFCQALEHFDHMTGLHHYYDQYVPDPYWSTYGVEKRAEFLETIGNDTVTEQQLHDLVRVGGSSGSAIQLLNKSFGHEFTEELRKDPVGIFKSMPRDQKIYLMRLANDNAPAGMAS